MTTGEVARRLGVNKSTVRRASNAHFAKTGRRAPGHVGDTSYSDEYLEWFDSRRRGSVEQVHETPIISGLTPASRIPDTDELWKRVTEMQKRDERKTESRYDQKVEIPGSKPVLLVLLADIHLGSRHTDYAKAKADAELVRDTPGVYAAILGDLIDSWITPKLLGIQREQPVRYAEELALMESWLGIMKGKLVAVVSGNHDLRTYDMAGLDLLQRALATAKVLYDQHEILFALKLGKAEWRWKLRHSWSHKSQYNSTHGVEWDSKFNDGSWQIAVGGHTHSATVFRSFVDAAHDNQVKLAVQLGSYSLDSAYGRKLNLPRIVPGGSAGIMFWPDGKYQPFIDLEVATRFLAMERAK